MTRQQAGPVPRFPECREISISDKERFDAVFTQRPPELSAYTFTNIFAWRKAHDWRVSELDGSLIVHSQGTQGISCLEPIGAYDPVRTMLEVARLAQSRTTFKRVQSKWAEAAREIASVNVADDRDNSDYLYLSSDLIDLPGRKFDAKRNFINRFKQTYSYEYLQITPENAMECHEFAEQWCEERDCESDEGLNHEICAVYQMLSHFGDLGMSGGAIKVNGAVVAFALGEPMNPDTLVVHVEKGDSSYAGIYQMINNEFAAHGALGYKYVNREQDLGIPGLRKAKRSYHPERMVESYWVTIDPTG